jgi:hypothetical protein
MGAMTDHSAQSAGDDVAYSYRPSLLGAAWSFRLTAGGLAWEAGRQSGLIPYRAIRGVRLSYKPVSMQQQRFLTEIWAEDAPKLAIVSTSWKSMVEQERQDKPYAAFVTELHRRIAQTQNQAQGRASAPVRFDQGRSPLVYWPAFVAYAGMGLGMVLLTVRALQSGAHGGAAFIAGFMVFFLWQGGNFFRRNKPGVYRPDALPDVLMPKG